MPKHGSVMLYVHRNHKAHQLYDGEPKMATSTFTQLLNSEILHLFIMIIKCSTEAELDSQSDDWQEIRRQ